ncbi:MAG: hypothetical protein ACJAV6_000165 [Candidatus Paceibacteria bacterium]|jgi:hypothetical protein
MWINIAHKLNKIYNYIDRTRGLTGPLVFFYNNITI